MSKILLKVSLKSKNEMHIFKGKGIKKDNKINYNDNGVMTVLTLGEVIYLERKDDFNLKLGFQLNQKIKGTYTLPEGVIDTETYTKEIKFTKNGIKINYDLTINNIFIDNFLFNLKYTIDS